MTKATFDLEENVASALCYALTWLTGLIFFLVEKENKNVRFHALQSFLVFLPLQILGAIFTTMLGVSYQTSGYMGYTYAVPTLSPLYYVGLAFYGIMFLVWLVMLISTFQGKKIKLPVIGDIAEKHA